MIHKVGSAEAFARCDFCMANSETYPEASAEADLHAAGWGKPPPPGLSDRWWCGPCLVKPKDVAHGPRRKARRR